MVDLSKDDTSVNQVCIDGSCRCRIKNNTINQLDIDDYARLQDDIDDTISDIDNNRSNTAKYWLLTKSNSNKPMLLKNTNSATENKRQTLCVVQCESKAEAIEVFRSKFKVLNISEDMVVGININIE